MSVSEIDLSIYCKHHSHEDCPGYFLTLDKVVWLFKFCKCDCHRGDG